MTNLWQDLVTNALLGTERKAFALAQTGGALGELLNRLEGADQALLLLQGAAIVALHQQAGRVPIDVEIPALSFCEADEVPACSERAAQHLALMLSGEYRDALVEWLKALAEAGKRVNAMLLPSLLNYAAANKIFRPLILPVIGRRGVWLALQNPEWSFVTSATLAAEIWQTGNAEDRLGALKQLRQDNPALALEWLSASWPQEAPPDRARFIEALQINVSMADEEFLENALDDKRKEVRRAAAEMLARLPPSRLCQRMLERASRLIEHKSGLRSRFDITLPEACDKAMARDGIDAASPFSQANDKLGQRGWWLAQILGAVPLEVWRKRWKISTAEMLKLSDKNEWQSALMLAWFNAAQRFRDEAMAEALLKIIVGKETPLFSPLPLVGLLPLPRREQVIGDLLKALGNKEQGKGAVMALIGYAIHQWSAGFTRLVLEHARQRIKADDRGWFYALRTWSYFMSPTLALEEVMKWKPQLEEYETKYAGEHIEAPLRFRCEMLEELRRGT
ncbi:MAG: hypothetical protein HY231_05760 [Acidobacteria bacterium]|nr:hypothetical protein [Acidobacteriota bacterium]